MDDQANNTLFRPPRKVTIVESIVDQIVEQVQQGKLNLAIAYPRSGN